MTTINKNLIGRSASLFILSGLILIASIAAFGQQTQTGTWKAKVHKKDSQKIQITFYSDKDNSYHKGKKHHSSSSFAIADLEGLSNSQINASESQVDFSIIREAGTFRLVGSFNKAKGSGNWTFNSDANFIATMANLGFDNISDEKLFASAIIDVRAQTVTELRNSGLDSLDYDDVFTATIFKINANFINEMSAAGFGKLDMDELVQARIFKIDGNYAREILALGFGKQSMDQLVQFRIFKITPDFVSDVKSEGLSNLSAGDLVQLKIFKIDSQFIQKARANGITNPSVGELVDLKILGKLK